MTLILNTTKVILMQRDERTTSLWPTLIYTLIISVFAVGSRLLPYYLPALSHGLWNLVPIGALGLFVGSRLRRHYAYLVPLLSMFVADLLLIRPVAELGYSALSWGRLPIYACFVLYVVIGRLLPERELSPLKVGGAAFVGSVQFFLITNFLVWYMGTTYPHTLEGLGICYAMGIPFYGNTLTGDLFFTGLFFGLHALIVRAIERGLARQPA
jgi:hypothetical protein